MNFNVVNIIDLLESVGEKEVRSALQEFECERNSEIEIFLKNNAIDFAKRKISVTHLILDDNGQIKRDSKGNYLKGEMPLSSVQTVCRLLAAERSLDVTN